MPHRLDYMIVRNINLWSTIDAYLLSTLQMFISAALCFVMYTLVFLRLRGNVDVQGWRIKFRFRQAASKNSLKSVDTHVINIAKGMLL